MKQVDPSLAAQFAFDAVDVAANRAGQLSPDQQAYFRTMARQARRRVPRVVLLLVLVVVGVLVFASTQPGVGRTQLVIAGGALIAAASVVLGITSLNYRMASAMEAAVVRMTQGPAVTGPDSTPGHWHVDIGGVRFHVTALDVDFFLPETTYRVYYTNVKVGTPLPLSMEIVD